MTNPTVSVKPKEAAVLQWILLLLGTGFSTEAAYDTTPATVGNRATAAVTDRSPPHNLENSPSKSVLHPEDFFPNTGAYILNDSRGKVCLKAFMGVQYMITMRKTISYFNVDPSSTEATGLCGQSTSFLTLKFNGGNLEFTFKKEGNVSYVTTVRASLETSACKSCKPEVFTGVISNETLFKAPDGLCYKCNTQRILQLAENLRIKIVHVQVQAFDIIDGQFGLVEECWPDHYKRIMPVVLGAIAVGMGLTVVITFLIVRDNRPQGYERI